MSIKIFLMDIDCGLPQDELVRVAAALTIQAQEHFGRALPFGWGFGASVRASTPDHAWADSDEWLMSLFSTPDIEGALGYHDMTPNGVPHLRVFPLLDRAEGHPWSITASHEVLEALVDPYCHRSAQTFAGSITALEICDAVERDAYPIFVGGVAVLVSNFVLPHYFEPPVNLSGIQFDAMGLVQYPGEIRPGGYGQTWDGNTWIQTINGSMRPARQAMARIGRSAHRARINSPDDLK